MKTLQRLRFPDPVEDAADLFGRDPVLEQIMVALRRRTVVVLGERLIGKTSVLNVIAQWADQQDDVALIRLAPFGSKAELMREILHSMYHWVAARVAGPVDHPDTPLSGAQFTSQISALAAQVPGVRFVLCVDEFDSLIAQGNKDAAAVTDVFAHLAELPRLPVRLLLTMSQIPEQVLGSLRSPFLNQATIVELVAWPEEDAVAFVDWLGGDDLRLDRGAHAALYAAAGGHPYFTKSVIAAVLASTSPVSDSSIVVTASLVEAAVHRAVRTREVDLALRNIVQVRLPASATRAMDLIAPAPAGVSARALVAAAVDPAALNHLVANGVLVRHGERYQFRSELWRQWWLVVLASRDPAPASGIWPAVKRFLARKAVVRALLVALAVFVAILVGGSALLLPTTTSAALGCDGVADGLEIRASYPSYVSSGDEHELRLVVINAGSTDSVDGTVVVGFPDGAIAVTSANSIKYDVLRPGEQRTQVVSFTSGAPASWFGPATGVPVQVRITVRGTACPPQQWSMRPAPIPRLQIVRQTAGTLALAVGVPVLVELFLIRQSRRRSTPRPGGTESAEGPR